MNSEPKYQSRYVKGPDPLYQSVVKNMFDIEKYYELKGEEQSKYQIDHIIRLVPLNKNSIFVDIGSFLGEEIRPLLKTECTIHSFEAHPICVRKLKEEFGSFDNIYLNDCAAWTANESRYFHFKHSLNSLNGGASLCTKKDTLNRGFNVIIKKFIKTTISWINSYILLGIGKNKIKINQRVYHKNFSYGSVADLNYAGVVVSFDSCGKKTVSKDELNFVLPGLGRQRDKGVLKKKVNCIDIAEYIEKIGKDIDVLKLDVEGSEYEILNHLLETGIYKKIKYIFFEDHTRKITDKNWKKYRRMVLERFLEHKISLYEI